MVPRLQSSRWGAAVFLRLGPKQDGYCKTAIVQVNDDAFDPPRGGNINNTRRTLRYETRQVVNYNPCDGASESVSEEDVNDDNEQDDNRERNSSNKESRREQLSTMDAGSLNVNENVESRLQKLGIDCDLSI